MKQYTEEEAAEFLGISPVRLQVLRHVGMAPIHTGRGKPNVRYSFGNLRRFQNSGLHRNILNNNLDLSRPRNYYEVRS